MANQNAPNGFRPVRHLNGGMIRLADYTIASGYATALYDGDAVEMTGTGKNIAQSAAGNADSCGVFHGCQYVDPQGRQVFSKYWPAAQVATEIKAFVYEDPSIVYEVQVSTLAAADVGQLADLAVGTGSAATGVSGAYIDASTLAATDKTFRIIGLVPRVDNAYGAYAKAEVIFVEHALKGVVAGVGGQ